MVGLAKIAFRQLDLAKRPRSIARLPHRVQVRSFRRVWYCFWLPTHKCRALAKCTQQCLRRILAALEEGHEEIEGERLRGIQMMKVLVQLDLGMVS